MNDTPTHYTIGRFPSVKFEIPKLLTPHMTFRTPRADVPKRTYLQETLLLCHPKMLLIIVCLTTIGHFLSPAPFDLTRYILGLLGVIFGVLGAYRFNEDADRTTAPSIPPSHNRGIGLTFLIIATIIAVYLSEQYERWILFLAATAVIFLVVYNALPKHPLHNKAVYAFIWGFVPLVFSEMLQSLTWPTATALLFGSWAMIIAVSTLYLWGPTTCGRLGSCSKAKGRPIKHKCHSPVLQCRDRVVMPKVVNDHMKVLIALNDAQVIVLTMAVVVMKFGGM